MRVPFVISESFHRRHTPANGVLQAPPISAASRGRTAISRRLAVFPSLRAVAVGLVPATG